jgi:hypothetical protein
MDLFAILSFDAPEPETAGATPIDAIPTNQCDGGWNGYCVVA